jgi:ABC-type transporter Mla subunit MlaD
MAEITIRISDKVLKIAGSAVLAVIVIWGVFEILQSDVLIRKYEVRMLIPEAGGLKEGAAVHLDGIRIGTVSGVALAGASPDPNRRVEVRLRIEKRYEDLIRTDSTASAITVGLLGEPSVNIHRGISASNIQPEGEIRFAPVKELSISPADFLSALGKLADCKKEAKSGEVKRSEGDSKPSARPK